MEPIIINDTDYIRGSRPMLCAISDVLHTLELLLTTAQMDEERMWSFWNVCCLDGICVSASLPIDPSVRNNSIILNIILDLERGFCYVCSVSLQIVLKTRHNVRNNLVEETSATTAIASWSMFQNIYSNAVVGGSYVVLCNYVSQY